MTGRLYRPETEREQKLQGHLDELYKEATHPPGHLKLRQPTAWEKFLAALKRIVGH
jgi:hypothetical protein